MLLYEGQKKHHAYIFDVKDRPQVSPIWGRLAPQGGRATERPPGCVVRTRSKAIYT